MYIDKTHTMSALIKDLPVRTYPRDFWKKFDESLFYIRRGRCRDFEYQIQQEQTFLRLHRVLYWFVLWDIKNGPIEVWAN